MTLQLQVHDPPVQDLRGSIKLEESQHWQHGENRAKKKNQTWQHGENRAQQKERKAQGNYTCPSERKKQHVSGKKNQMKGTNVTL